MSTIDIKNLPTDIELMMFADGELAPARAKEVQEYLSRNSEAQGKADAVGELRELVRGSLELATDEQEVRLDGLWAKIESGIDAEPVEAMVSQPASVLHAEEKATQALIDSVAKPANQGWFSSWQSHIATGALAAAAVAVFMLIGQRGGKADTSQSNPEMSVAKHSGNEKSGLVPVRLASQAPEVEALEVWGGTGVVMTIPGETDDDDDSASAVIWISTDNDLVEDPI